MVSALHSGASGLASSPGLGHCVDCVLGQDGTYWAGSEFIWNAGG